MEVEKGRPALILADGAQVVVRDGGDLHNGLKALDLQLSHRLGREELVSRGETIAARIENGWQLALELGMCNGVCDGVREGAQQLLTIASCGSGDIGGSSSDAGQQQRQLGDCHCEDSKGNR